MAMPTVATRGCRVTVYRHEQLAARAQGCSVELNPETDAEEVAPLAL